MFSKHSWFGSVKDSANTYLKGERQLELNLHKLKNYSKSLEKELEEARAKRHKAAEELNADEARHATASLNLSVEQNKMTKLQKINDTYVKDMEDLDIKIKESKDQFIMDIKKFEDSMRNLCVLFKNGATNYTTDSLQAENLNLFIEEENIKEKAKDVECELERTKAELDDMTQYHPPLNPCELDVPLEQRKLLKKLFLDEKAAAEESLNYCREQEARLEDELRNLNFRS